MKSNSDYYVMICKLKNMTDEQLIELFHDLKDEDLIGRISELSYKFCEGMLTLPEDNDDNHKSDSQEYTEVDNLRRASEGI